MSRSWVKIDMEQNPDRFMINLPEMDAQHEYLHSLFELLGSPAYTSDRNKLKQVLSEIELYLLFHFSCEEHLMRLYRFPGFAAHQSDHEQAGTKLIQFLDDFESEKLNPAALRIFLSGWLLEHSRISDTEYVAWVKNKRSEIYNKS